jgi:ABC-type transport system involved in multi-copper enzyme maturation permease subunit
MAGLIALLRHEVAQRRLLLLAGALAGLLPFAAPLVSGAAPADVPDLREYVAVFFAAALSALAAIFLGATAISSDLAERRLSFFFSRPLAGWTIWAGKLGGAALCAWAVGALALLPALLAAGGGGLQHNPAAPASL